MQDQSPRIPDPGAPSARARNIARLFAPESIAFVGGTRAIAAWRTTRAKGFAGKLYMVNPMKPEIDGIRTWASVDDLPEAPDAAYVALDPAKTIATTRILARRGAGGVVAFGAGFSEVGPDGAALEAELVGAAGDLALVGPNCYGIVNLVSHGSLWPIDYPAPDMPPNVAVISQSGNVAINIVGNQRGVPLSHVVSLGNQAGLQVHDMIDHFLAEGRVRAIGLYLDGLRDVAAFHDACLRAARKGVGIVVLKAGISEISAELALSHTGSLAGSKQMYHALFERLGVTWVRTIPELLEALRIWSHWGGVPGNRVAFFSCSGGESGMAADFAADAGLHMEQPDPAQRAELARILPEFGAISNPLDMTTALFGQREPLARAVRALMAGPSDTAILVMDFASEELVPGSAPDLMVHGLADACAATGTRAVVATMKPESLPPKVQSALLARGVLPMQGLDTGCKVLAQIARACARHAHIREAPPAPLLTGPRPDDAPLLDEAESKALLASVGLSVPQGRAVPIGRAGEAAERIGFPVVVKACLAALPHKTEAGGVRLNIRSAAEAMAAAGAIRDSVAAHDPGLTLTHVLVEEMAEGAVAELILGVTHDPQFGLAVVVGTGGIFVELLKDAVTLLLPTDPETVRAAVSGLTGAPLFMGYRGRAAGDLGAVVDAVMALSRFAETHAGRLAEVDINPLFVMPEGRGVLAGDALLRLSPGQP